MKKDKKITGKEYWRSLDQLAETEDFKKFLHREFPENASEMTSPTRRKFLTLMGASIGMAGLAGCRRPVEKIIPYVVKPEEITLGNVQYYATTMPFGNSAYGLVVHSYEGRPTKLEGNASHPSSLGSSNSFIDASILSLYDPDRAKKVTQGGQDRQWSDFVTAWGALDAQYAANRGQGLAVLAESFSSPTLSRLARNFMNKYPAAKWVTYEPVSEENVYAGIRAATGRRYRPVYQLANAKAVVALDSDFLVTESENIVNSRGFADGRRVASTTDAMNRLYVVESSFSLTGGMADHRLRLQSGQIGAFAAALANELVSQGLSIPAASSISVQGNGQFDAAWITAVARDLMANRGSSAVVAGRRQPASVHALVYAINSALGNNGQTVVYHDLTDATTSDTSTFAQLVADMGAGSISTLMILGGNPVYSAPADLNFATQLGQVQNTIHLSTDFNETSQAANWHIPQSHFLEAWGDARSANGTLSVIQPLIAPLFDSKSTIELLELVNTGNEQPGHDIVQETWNNILPRANFQKSWRKVLHDGVLENSTTSRRTPAVSTNALRTFLAANAFNAAPVNSGSFEINFSASQTLYDGRFANNGWLQELSDPVTKLTWDNAALMSPATARQLNVMDEDVVQLSYKGNSIELPVLILPGHVDNSVTVELGYGRTSSGKVGDNVGSNVYQLRTSQTPDFDSGLSVSKTGQTYLLSRTQDHHSMEGRALIREGTLDEFRDNPNFAEEMVVHPPLESLWTEHKYDQGYQWGMTVDLNVCTGCNACSIACQSENNIPVVGKEQVRLGREMSWMRIDRYFTGDEDNPEMVNQPVACQHCELAPCEQVCPVAATTHDEEGLNTMTYNRCIGTRYCSNNCPYKVRRFNFFNYTNDTPELVKMAQNPDVTVRFRGVMEKCTFCVQRISRAKIDAKNEGRTLGGDDVKTACQQTCPTNAIVFGDINNPDSEVSQIKKQERNYGMLSELNLKTRNTFLAKLRNPNPEIS